MNENEARVAAQKIAVSLDADVLVYNGDIEQEYSSELVKKLSVRNKARNVVLVLTTPGGSPDAAFKIGRCLQNSYDNFTLFVPGWCKSAGTLVAIAADELVIGNRGELGPLDIQIAKSDEIMELGSGLTVDAAMKALEQTAQKMFVNLVVSIRRDTGGGLTTRTSADLAAKMVTGMLEPIFRQIDPIKIGENSRAMQITKGYGSRLNLRSKNLRSAAMLDFLVQAYPDHSFVIDRQEACLIFKCVSEPNALFIDLEEAMGREALVPSRSLARKDGMPYIEFLSDERVIRSKQDAPQKASGGSRKRARKVVKPRANGRLAPDSRV